MGEAVARLPPRVARLRICRPAKTESIFASEGYSPQRASSTAVRVAAAPILHSEGFEMMRPNSGIPSTEMRAGKRLNFLFNSTPTSVAPATSVASGFARLSSKSPASETGRLKLSAPSA